MLTFSRFRVLGAALIAVGMSATSMAQEAPSSGLGQAWPNAPDVSANPHWHVYVFARDGVRYVQVNDANGGVKGAIATAGGEVLVLPIGSDAANVTTAPAADNGSSSSETVYNDGDVAISAAVQPTGVVQLKVSTGCDDPVECSTHIAPDN